MLKKSVELSKLYLKNYVHAGDTVVDMTCGNGKDTLFLYQLVKDNGTVYAFDIQEQAIKATKNLLKNAGNIHFICDGHQNILQYIDRKIKAFVFNLGYLPGGDHSIATTPENTITAIENALSMLDELGIILLSIYHGGDTGFLEKEALLPYLKQLDKQKYNVILHEYINKPNHPPLLCVITHNEVPAK